MKNTCIIVSILTLLILSISYAEVSKDRFSRPEIYFRFQIESKDELIEITRIISIDNVIGDTVYAYANRKEFERFQKLSKKTEMLPVPSLIFKPEMSESVKGVALWDSYPTYNTYVSMMYQFAIDYPELCRIDSIGASINGRVILFAVISDNVQSEEAEPEVMYTSTMHGDETTGYVLMLRLIDYLLTNYQSDKRVSDLVDNLEIWINPLANPDGTYYLGDSTVYGATRFNANGVDLNRNFPDPKIGDHPDGNPRQPETIAMMELAERQNFVLSANFHGGADLLNYPWDCWERRHADDEWLIWLCCQYADTVHAYSPSGYLTDMNNGVTNGWDWYTIYGGRQDYMTYYQHCREVTIEISNTKLLPESELTAYWEYNREALLNYLSAALCGIKGEIRTGQELIDMQISIIGHEIDNSWVVPDEDFGDYYRLCLPGVYQLEITSGGELTTIEKITVGTGQSTRVNLITGTIIPGDINGDNDINIADVVLIQNFIAELSIPSPAEFNSADWNGDGILNRVDLNQITQFLLNLYP